MSKQINFNLDFKEFKETESFGEFEGILVNYEHKKLGHGYYKFGKGSMTQNEGKCALCMVKTRYCRSKEDGTAPAFCSTKLYPEAIEKAVAEYAKPDIHQFARNASLQEAECYIDRAATPHYKFPVKPRVQEIIEFSRKMGYKKLGVAFCG